MSSSRPTPAGPRKSALRVASLSTGTPLTQSRPQALPQRGALTPEEFREISIAEFEAWLQEQTSPKTKRRYERKTIGLYCDAARTLHAWLTAEGNEGDFAACDTDTLNRFFSAYLKTHTQGGTNTLQRNLAHLFTWLEAAYDVPTPYAQKLHRYGPNKAKPSTLSDEFIADLLEVTGRGRARAFEDIRDHAIIRVLSEGPRLTEVSSMRMSDLPLSLIAQPVFRLTPLKGARSSNEGRLMPLSQATAKSVTVYLRARASHRFAGSPALWLGTRNRQGLTSSGIYQMVKRRTAAAGYPVEEVHPHMFRDTFCHNWLDRGGSEGDLMRLMGWTNRSMLDRYTEDMQVQRAVTARLRQGDFY